MARTQLDALIASTNHQGSGLFNALFFGGLTYVYASRARMGAWNCAIGRVCIVAY